MMPRTFLITASTGIGAETARQLARLGHNLFIVSRTEEHAHSLANEVSTLGAKSSFLAGDLRDLEVGPSAVRKCVKTFGRLDGLFNVAGISGRKFGDGPLHECSEEGFRTVIETNLTTQYRLCREALCYMLKQRPHPENKQRGVILNMASILGIHPEPRHFASIAYAAAKGGIISLTQSAAAFYAPERIRINAIAPGLASTSMSARASEDPNILRFMKQKQPLAGGTIPVPDIAAACVFLLTDASRSITGEVIHVDAGWGVV